MTNEFDLLDDENGEDLWDDTADIIDASGAMFTLQDGAYVEGEQIIVILKGLRERGWIFSMDEDDRLEILQRFANIGWTAHENARREGRNLRVDILERAMDDGS